MNDRLPQGKGRSRVLALILALAAAAPAAADCPWPDDGELANALAGSRWRVTSATRYAVNGPRLHIDRDRRAFDLAIGPLLHDIVVDGAALTLRLEPGPLPRQHVIEIGRNRVIVPYPDMAGAPCAAAPLSVLRGEGQTTLEGRRARITVELWPASGTRLAGMIRVERIDAFDRPRALIEPVEASPQP